MNRKKIEEDILWAYTSKQHDKLMSLYVQLINLRAKMDRWFNKYLEMFDEKMNSSNRSDPVWKLYHAKHDEYSDIAHAVKIAEYYLKKS